MSCTRFGEAAKAADTIGSVAKCVARLRGLDIQLIRRPRADALGYVVPGRLRGPLIVSHHRIHEPEN